MAEVLPFSARPGARPPVPSPGGQPPEGPPTWPSPATMPVQGRGEQAAGMAHLSVAVHVLEQALPLLGMGTEAGRDVNLALTKLAKHTPPGQVSSGVENSILQKLLLQNRQNAMNVAAMRGQAGGAPAGAAGAKPPGAPPSPQPGAAPPPMAA